MKKILIIHKDEMYAEFISHYLDASGFVVGWTTNNVEGFTMAVKMKPDLIIMSKESEYLDLGGFLLKKKHNQGLSEAPIFLVGNFFPSRNSRPETEAYSRVPVSEIKPPGIDRADISVFFPSEGKHWKAHAHDDGYPF
jgi:chemotaxis response regulator CheB